VMRMSAALGLAGFSLVAACAPKEVILPGERFDVRAPLEDSIAYEGKPAPVDTTGKVTNLSVPISLPAPQANGDWTHRGGNARHRPPHGVLSAQPVRVFSVKIGEGNSRRNRISAAPVIAGGKVFTLDASAQLAATSTGGQALWATDLTPVTDRASEVSGGGLAYGAGKVFAATGYGELVAVDPASGAVVWRQRLESPVTGAPAVEGTTVYVVGRDSSGWAVDTETGRVLWTIAGTPGSSGMIGSAAPAITDRAVLLPSVAGEVVAALKGTGIRIWGTAVAGERRGRAYGSISDITGDPVVTGDVTYVGNASGRTIAMSSSSGEQIWSATEGALGPVLAVGGSLFLVNDEARLVRLDAATGKVIWSVEMPYFVDAKVKRHKAITAHYGPVLAGGRIVVASGDGLLRLFNPSDGTMVATAPIPGGAASPPALAGGILYVVGGNGQLHAFR
jgi:outer membrane protein assembly factor BamB